MPADYVPRILDLVWLERCEHEEREDRRHQQVVQVDVVLRSR